MGEIKFAPVVIAVALGCVAIDAHTATPLPKIDPRAVDALGRMSAYLKTLSAFEINLQTQRDDVDMYGQLITLSGRATYRVQRPNAFSIDLALPTQSGRYVYDGKTVVAYDTRANAYKRFQAPSTIRATLDLAETKYGATVPLDDLFRWGDGDAKASVLTSAHYIGKTQIAGQTANHYAFRQPGRDWQIWIADGARPAPLRISIVASNDTAKPEFQADLAWNTAPRFAPTTFAFAPPPNSRPLP